jgi:hypothetical protein
MSKENPKDVFGSSKCPLHLVPSAAIKAEAWAMQSGADKYGAWNWRECNVRSTVYMSAALRHIYAWFDGQDSDGDSGVHHLGHARACLGLILDSIENECLMDDRPDSNVYDIHLQHTSSRLFDENLSEIDGTFTNPAADPSKPMHFIKKAE